MSIRQYAYVMTSNKALFVMDRYYGEVALWSNASGGAARLDSDWHYKVMSAVAHLLDMVRGNGIEVGSSNTPTLLIINKWQEDESYQS
jgi:hypothetical protein